MKTCNHEPKKVFSYDGINYLAADEDNTGVFRGDLIVNLTQNPGIRTLSTAYDIPELAGHVVKLPPEIVVAWVDMSRPPVKGSFWAALHLYCKNKGYKNVLFHCQHGHGRTGTALSSMLISLKKYDVEKAVNYVRRNHCRLAIETEIQLIYLIMLDNELNGRLPPEEESDLEQMVYDLLPPRLMKKKSYSNSDFEQED
jgi:hypothetical protein